MGVDVCILAHHNLNERKYNFEKLTKPIICFPHRVCS